MGKFIDLAGRKYGRISVVRMMPDRVRRKITWECLCECGKISVVEGEKLRSGHTQSCGCLHQEIIARGNPKHGGRYKAEYGIWCEMIKRCDNPRHISFKYYGGRGISVAAEWREFTRFFADMGPRPSTAHSIDRIDVNGNYAPGNCRWATPKEQMANTRAALARNCCASSRPPA